MNSAADAHHREMPEVSVVLAVPGRNDDVMRSLNAIRRAASECTVEVIVVAQKDAFDGRGVNDAEPVRLLVEQVPEGLLTPCLWAAGLRRASGKIVAFTTAQCEVPVSWIQAMRQGLADGHAGVGGPIQLANDGSTTDWAVFHLRYSAFMAVPASGGHAVEIPGDNAAYSHSILARHQGAFRDGFWEVELHRLLRATGDKLRMVPGMTVSFGRTPGLWSIAAQRFEHGKHSGAWRVRNGVRKRWQVVCAVPLVPALLVARIIGAVRRHDGKIRLAAIPALGILATAWAVGEGIGALNRREQARCPGVA